MLQEYQYNVTSTRLSCCYTQFHVAQLANDTLFNSLFQSQLWSIVTSGGSAFHNISWRHTAATPGTGLLLARSVAGPKVGDYSWHGTTPGTGLLLARDTGQCIVQSTLLLSFFFAEPGSYRRGRLSDRHIAMKSNNTWTLL